MYPSDSFNYTRSEIIIVYYAVAYCFGYISIWSWTTLLMSPQYCQKNLNFWEFKDHKSGEKHGN